MALGPQLPAPLAGLVVDDPRPGAVLGAVDAVDPSPEVDGARDRKGNGNVVEVEFGGDRNPSLHAPVRRRRR